MPKRQKKNKDDKILDCERPPPGLTLASFLDASSALQNVSQEYQDVDNLTATGIDGASAGNGLEQADGGATSSAAEPVTTTPAYTIRKNKKGSLPISYENRNKGKKVTVISNVNGDASALVSELKRLTGSGGVQKGECIELQGDRRDFVTKYLKGHACVVQR